MWLLSVTGSHPPTHLTKPLKWIASCLAENWWQPYFWIFGYFNTRVVITLLCTTSSIFHRSVFPAIKQPFLVLLIFLIDLNIYLPNDVSIVLCTWYINILCLFGEFNHIYTTWNLVNLFFYFYLVRSNFPYDIFTYSLSGESVAL